jgi:membrane protein
MSTALWNRGRTANSPKDIPWKGWRDIFYRVKIQLGEDKISVLSAAMAYYVLFAFVPAITSVIVVYAWVSDPAQIAIHMQKISNILPAEARDILGTQLQTLSSNASSTLGISAIGGLLFSLWSASKGSKALMDSLNTIYGEKETRGFLKYNFVALGLTFLGTILSLLALAVVIVIPALFAELNLTERFSMGVWALSWLALLGIFSFYLALVYRLGPARTKAKWRWVSWGAVFSAFVWALSSVLFSWYAASFGNFNKTYGSLGAFIGLMMWFFVSSYVILLGGEINAEIEHQTLRDSTTGWPKILGIRGAFMADSIGAGSGISKAKRIWQKKIKS